uniref:Uncharacterized protein n=1 Tax=Mustela putorius furo TaxID=9669 RepID=M3XTZ3_MUSPF
ERAAPREAGAARARARAPTAPQGASLLHTRLAGTWGNGEWPVGRRRQQESAQEVNRPSSQSPRDPKTKTKHEDPAQKPRQRQDAALWSCPLEETARIPVNDGLYSGNNGTVEMGSTSPLTSERPACLPFS